MNPFLLTLMATVLTFDAPDSTTLTCVTLAAHDGLSTLLRVVPIDSVTSYGFTTADEIPLANIGLPLRLHAITPNALHSHTPGQGVQGLLSQTNSWFVPIVSHGKHVAFIVVERTAQGECSAVALGFARLASKLVEARRARPWIADSEFTLIAINEAQEFLLAVPDRHPDKLLSLEPRGAPEQDSGSLSDDLEKTVIRLREAVTLTERRTP